MMKCTFLSLILLIFGANTLGQRFKGSIKDEAGKPIQAGISIMDNKSTDLVKELYQSNEKGFFDFVIQNSQDKILFKIRAMGFAVHSDSIINPKVDNTYLYEIKLKTESLELEEVIVRSTRQVVVKKDTIEYYPKSFLNGSERKVEDLIKKLPGMEVSENGAIKYFGKIVESVQLDGDDIFGDKYAIGTKNIAVETIEKVQAIDNFTVNPLLNGLVKSETVSLNLVLKKTKTKYSADVNVGVANGIRDDLGVNILAFNNRFKSFANVTHNNVGVNYWFYDYFNNSNGEGDNNIKNKIAEKIIPISGFSNELNMDNANINNSFTANYHFLVRLSQKLSLKTHLNYSNEVLKKEEFNKSAFFTQNIVYDDYKQNVSSPINKELGCQLDYFISKKSYIVFESSLHQENIQFNADVLQNQTAKINKSLFTTNNFWNNQFRYTLRINKFSALQWKSTYTTNSINQNLALSSDLGNLIGDNQSITNKKEYFENQLLYFFAKNRLKLDASLVNNISQNPLKSNLTSNGNDVDNFKNDFIYKLTSFYGNINALQTYKFLELKLGFKVASYTQQVTHFPENNLTEKQSIVGMPSFTILFTPSILHKINLSGKLDYLPVTSSNLFENNLLQDTRTIKKNEVNVNVQKSQQYNLTYRFNEPFSFFSTLIGTTITRDYNTYLSKINLDENYTTFTYFRSPTNIDNILLLLGVDKLLSALKLSVKYSSTFSIFNYKNVVNESEIRNNESLSHNHSIFLKTGFSLPFSFENKFSYNNTQSFTDGQFNNKVVGWSDNLKFIYKPNQLLLFSLNLNIINPNIEQNNLYRFLNFEFSLKPKKQTKIIEYRIIGKNLLNTTFYKTTSTSDYVVSSYQSNLLPRYIMLALRFNV